MGIHAFIKRHAGEGWNLIDYATPNRLGYTCLIEKDGTYLVVSEDPDPENWNEPNEFETDDAVDARKVYDDWVSELMNTPNWDAQREYDALHGTVNGEDPGIAEMRELWGEY